MKKIFFFLLFVQSATGLAAQTLIYTEDFETNGEGTRYNSNTYSDCTNSDYFFRTNTNPVTPPACGATFGTTLTNLQGSFYWASEDIRSSSPVPGARPPGFITTQAITVTGYSGLSVSLFLATSNNNNARWESADSINIQASFDGVNYITVGRFMGKGTALVGARLGIDDNLDGVYNGADPATDCDVADFTQYSFSIPGNGNNLFIRLDFDQLGGTEELAIDQIQVRGTSTLPVKIHNFNGRTTGNLDLLSWKIEDPEEAALFIVEESNDGMAFQQRTTFLPGMDQQYELPLQIVNQSFRYYRLKIRDRNGREIISAIVKLGGYHDSWSLKVLNPAAGGSTLYVSIQAPETVAATMLLYGMDGQLKSSSCLQLAKGSTVLPLPDLPGGVYLLRLVQNDRHVLGSLKFQCSGY